LCVIAVEDIGIADIGLLQDVAVIGTDKHLRSVLGSDAELIDDLCRRMALATKDRSADYLYSAATMLECASAERSALALSSLDHLVEIASEPGLPLIRRAVAVLLACTQQRGAELVILPDRSEQLLDAISVKHMQLHDAILRLARSRMYPFCLLLPLIWSRWSYDRCEPQIVEDALPVPEFVDRVPLYTFDKHTALGSQAIARFARQNGPTAATLKQWVPEHRRRDVAAIAAFYADAAPVARRLEWSTGSELSQIGTFADMVDAGCEPDGVQTVLNCARENLPHLNQLRRAELGRSTTARK